MDALCLPGLVILVFIKAIKLSYKCCMYSKNIFIVSGEIPYCLLITCYVNMKLKTHKKKCLNITALVYLIKRHYDQLGISIANHI